MISTAETTARGAAFLAGLGVGIWKDPEELRALWEESARFRPAGNAETLAAQRRGWQAAVNRCRNWAREVQGDET